MTEDGAVSTDGWTTACRTLLPLYDRLFNSMLESMLKKYLESDIVSVEKARAAALAAKDGPAFDGNDGDTLERLLTLEDKTMGAKRGSNKTSGTFGLLWTKRSAAMISKQLFYLATREDMDAGKCCQTAYEETIKKYHGWMVASGTQLAMRQAPNKTALLSKLGISSDREPALSLVRALDACLKGLEEAVNKTGSNFEDKL
jgi:pleckstrin family protein A (phosphoinositide binding specific) protein 8